MKARLTFKKYLGPKSSWKERHKNSYWPGINDNELLEIFVAYFFLLYAVVLWRRINRHQPV